MPPFEAVSETYGALIETTPAALTLMGDVPVIAPPPLDVTQVGQVSVPVVALSTSGVVAFAASVPEVFGKSSVGEPVAGCGLRMAVPLVAPAKPSWPVEVPGIPSTGAVVAEGTADEAEGLPRTVPPAIGVKLPAGIVVNVGSAVEPVALPQNLFAPACPVH